ncbi:MAG: GNAT family N-acetyltransferase [Alistipes sp.]
MIDFKPVTLSDRAHIEAYVQAANCSNCDMAFANMFCWQFVFQSAWAEVDGLLLIRFRIGGGGEIGYMQPIGDKDFTRIIPALEENALSHGQRLRLIGLSDEGCTLLQTTHPGEFAFDSNRNQEDYIYLAEDLRTLSGRKYQPKRNHINRFTATYSFRYEPLTREHFAECLQLERQWEKAHNDRPAEHSIEQRVMQLAFAHFEELALFGGCIYVADQLVAFTYGSAINADTFICHVEKADTDYDGAFTLINKLLAEHLPASILHINREEDMGIAGLRQSKLSYHPTLLLHKFMAIRLTPEEAACKKLWQSCFEDEEEFIDRFLIHFYKAERSLTATVNGAITATLHILPFESACGSIGYIYGVATAPAFRGGGLASNLMRRALTTQYSRGDILSILIPGEPWLKAFYARFGYADTSLPVVFSSASSFDFGTGDAQQDLAMVRIIQVSAYLEQQAAEQPNLTLDFYLSDTDLIANSGHYRVAKGQVLRDNTPCNTTFTPAELVLHTFSAQHLNCRLVESID